MDKSLCQPCVIKEIHKGDPKLLELCAREASILLSLNNTRLCIPRLLYYTEEEGFFVEEFIEGQTLSKLTLTEEEVIDHIMQHVATMTH